MNKDKKHILSFSKEPAHQKLNANSPEFIPEPFDDHDPAFTDSLNDVYDFIPEIKPNKYRR